MIWRAWLIAAVAALPVSVTAQSTEVDRDFGSRLPTALGVPNPSIKPAQPTTLGATQPRDRASARASRLFEGALGDESLGEGVIIFGPSPGAPLTLELLQALGADSARGLDSQANTLGVAGDIQTESEQARFLRDRARAAASLVAKEPPILFDYARLRALDKVTARISNLTIPVGTSALFGRLSITVRGCQKTPPSEPPESAAFVLIEELDPSGALVQNFSGWMFASNPAISGLEHAVYDVWVAGCTNAASASSDSVSTSGG